MWRCFGRCVRKRGGGFGYLSPHAEHDCRCSTDDFTLMLVGCNEVFLPLLCLCVFSKGREVVLKECQIFP